MWLQLQELSMCRCSCRFVMHLLNVCDDRRALCCAEQPRDEQHRVEHLNSATSHAPRVSSCRHTAGEGRIAVGETVILLHPPLPLVGISIVMKRGWDFSKMTVSPMAIVARASPVGEAAVGRAGHEGVGLKEARINSAETSEHHLI